jgi:hypothetical protein
METVVFDKRIVALLTDRDITEEPFYHGVTRNTAMHLLANPLNDNARAPRINDIASLSMVMRIVKGDLRDEKRWSPILLDSKSGMVLDGTHKLMAFLHSKLHMAIMPFVLVVQ